MNDGFEAGPGERGGAGGGERNVLKNMPGSPRQVCRASVVSSRRQSVFSFAHRRFCKRVISAVIGLLTNILR
jgi:hypothetical protein